MSTRKPLDLALKALFLTSLLAAFGLAFTAVLFRLDALPKLAKILPKEDTEFFAIFTLKPDWASFMGTPVTQLPWIDSWGLAQVKGQKLSLAEVNDTAAAQAFLDATLIPGQVRTETRATQSLWSTIYCNPAPSTTCFTWIGDLLFTSEDPSILDSIQKVASHQEASVADSPHYQNVNSRLASWTGGFVYADLEKLQPDWLQTSGAMEALLKLYPVFGATLRQQAGEVTAESFLAVNKNSIGGGAYWHPTQKYEAKLLPWTPDTFAFEWGGLDASAQWEQIKALLQSLDPSARELADADFTTRLKSLFGPDVDFTRDLAPLLDGEQYLGFTPGKDFLALTQLNSPEEISLASRLKDQFGAHHLFAQNFQTPSGETQARSVPLVQSTGQYNGIQYYSFTAEGEPVATVLFLENLAIVGSSEQVVFDALDRIQKTQTARDLDSWKDLLSGADEIFSVHCLLLPDGSILKTLFNGFNTVVSTRKLFDDGIFTRSSLTVSHD